MKLNLILTTAELLEILSKHFNTQITNFEIVESVHNQYTEELLKAVCAAGNPYYAASKIPCIKALRTFVPGLGLADAKWMIENWEQTIQFVKQHGRTPSLSGGWNDVKTLS